MRRAESIGDDDSLYRMRGEKGLDCAQIGLFLSMMNAC